MLLMPLLSLELSTTQLTGLWFNWLDIELQRADSLSLSSHRFTIEVLMDCLIGCQSGLGRGS